MDGKECKTNLDCDLFQLIHQCSSSSFKICHDYLVVAVTTTKVHSKHSIKITRTRSLLLEKISSTLIQVYADNIVFSFSKIRLCL